MSRPSSKPIPASYSSSGVTDAMAPKTGPSAAIPSATSITPSSATGGAVVEANGQITMELEHAVGFDGTLLNTLFLHNNGNEYVTVSGASVVINDLTDPHQQIFLRGHDDHISCMAMSKSGRLLASGQIGDNSDVCVWDVTKKNLLYRLSEHYHGISCLAFSDDERFLVTVGDAVDKKMFVWDLQTGNIVGTAAVNPDPTRRIVWGGRVKDIKRRPTSDYLLATAGDAFIRLWVLSPSTGALTCEKIQMNNLERKYTCLAFSTDGEKLFAGTETGDFAVIYIRTKTLLATVPCCAGGIFSLALSTASSADSSCLFVGGGDGSVVQFVEQGKDFVQTSKTVLTGSVTSLSPSEDGLEIAAATDKGNLYRIRASTFEHLLVSESHSSPVVAIKYARGNSNCFCTCSSDGSIRVWDASTYSVISRANVNGVSPSCLAFSEEIIITGWSDGRIRSFDTATGEPLWNIVDAHPNGVTALALSPNYKFIVSGGQNGEVRVWEIRSRELVCHLKEHNARVNDVLIFNDNVHVLSCSRDRSFLCWDLQQERRVSSHSQRMGGITAMSLSRDQNLILTVGQEKKITYWDMREVNPLQSIFPAHAEEATCIAISQDGTLIVTGGTDQRVKVWEFSTGKCLAEGIGHSDVVTSVSFSPDDKQVVSVGLDGSILIWNLFRL